MRRLLGEESQVDEKRPSIRGSLWMIVAGVLFASMGVFVKLGLKYFSSSELVFYRSLFGVVLIFLVVRVNGLAVYSPNWTLHISRSLAGFAGMMLLFYVIGILPLSTATTLNYTSPLFLVVLSALVLRERLKPGLVLAVVLGFAGVVLLLRPTFSANQTVAGLLGLASGFFAGVAYLTTKHLGRLGEPGWRVVFYFTLVSTIGGLARVAWCRRLRHFRPACDDPRLPRGRHADGRQPGLQHGNFHHLVQPIHLARCASNRQLVCDGTHYCQRDIGRKIGFE
jgi:drug/metabolite transporter (DMT)-like permease